MHDLILWSTWIGGISIGLYAVLQLALTRQHLGVSTGYGNVCSLASRQPYFHKGAYADATNWRLWFILGLPLGGLLAGLTSPGAFEATASMGSVYDSVMPESFWLRALVLTVAGVALGLGARMAGGCTSGHGIAGLALLNGPSLLATVGFFIGGIVTVQLLFGLAQ